MKTIDKVLKEKDGSEHFYTYSEPESVQETIGLFGETKTLQLIRYALSSSERKKAYPSGKDVKNLIESDPELKELYQRKLEEKKAALRRG